MRNMKITQTKLTTNCFSQLFLTLKDQYKKIND